MKLILSLLALTMLCGCAELPFRQVEPVTMDRVEPKELLERFSAKLPENTSQLNSIVFEFAGQKFLGLGFLEINHRERSFRVVCLNPMGVKLFDLSGDDHGTTTNYAMEPLASAGNIAVAVSADIRRIYFDTIPKKNATSHNCGNRVIFGGGTPSGYQEHVFAGASPDLVEKRFYDDQLISWRVGYYEYLEKDGRRYPRGIIITDYKNGYQLTIRQKEQSLEED